MNRYLRSTTGDFFAVAPPGLEKILESEVRNLPHVQEVFPGPEGVGFRGPLRLIREANLRLATASRVLYRLAAFPATEKGELRNRLRRIPWELYLPDSRAFRIRATSRKSRLLHTGMIAENTIAAIKERCPWLYSGESSGSAEIRIRLDQDFVTVSLDTSGENLHRRGYGEHRLEAPLRETLAAGVWKYFFSGYSGVVLDPFCGSGTLLLESAREMAGLFPGIWRSFAFESLPLARLFTALDRSRLLQEKAVFPEGTLFWGNDLEKRALEASRHNLGLLAGEQSWPFQWTGQDARTLQPLPDLKNGVFLSNLPYGERLSGSPTLLREFLKNGQVSFPGWEGVLIFPAEWYSSGILSGLQKGTGGNLDPLFFSNGGIRVVAAGLSFR